MNKKQERIGFTTSATKLEDKFDEIQNWISSKQKVWGSLMDLSIKYANESKKELHKLFKSKTKDYIRIDKITTERRSWNIIGIVASLGLHVTENQERLNKIEKGIEEVKLKL